MQGGHGRAGVTGRRVVNCALACAWCFGECWLFLLLRLLTVMMRLVGQMVLWLKGVRVVVLCVVLLCVGQRGVPVLVLLCICLLLVRGPLL